MSLNVGAPTSTNPRLKSRSARSKTVTYFILLVRKIVKNFDVSLLGSQQANVDLQPGTLLLFKEEINRQGSVELLLETLEKEARLTLQCRPVTEVEELDSRIADLLKPIPNHKECLQVYRDKSWLNFGERLTIGSSVYVKLKGEQRELEGTVRYRGFDVPGYEGCMFGIDLKERKGYSDGCYRNQTFFHTDPNHAVFVPLNKIKGRRDEWLNESRHRMDQNREAQYYKPESSNSRLKIGERVIWMSDNGPESGTTSWIGSLPDDPQDKITVGVTFDNPVGTGTGWYKNNKLFIAKQGHASLIPLMGLMREKDFNGESAAGVTKFQDGISSLELTDESQHGNLDIPYMDQTELQPRKAQYQEKLILPSETTDLPSGKAQKFGGMNPLYEHSRLHDSGSNDMVAASKVPLPTTYGRGVNADHQDLTVGSLVEVQLKNPLYGVIRWIGVTDDKLTAGVELEWEISAGTDGTFKNDRYFNCAPKRAFFLPLNKCRKDTRFLIPNHEVNEFGGLSTPDIKGDIAPLEPSSNMDYNFQLICGKNKGIQGHHNSCYLDATLFCMFYFTTVFDFICNRPFSENDLPQYTQVQQVLKEGIVNPLRRYNYVRADKVVKLRALLHELGTVPGMMSEEKDPEEFLSALLTQIMKADPLLHLSSGEDTYFYQLFMEKDKNLLLPTTQKLVELSFMQGDVKLKEVPSCFMIQMPRFGKDYKMFHRIVPSLQLDITDILENCPRDCIVCGALASYECKDCYQIHGPGLNTTAFCEKCVKKSHQHMSRKSHKPQQISTAKDFLPYYEQLTQTAMKIAEAEGRDYNDITVPLPRETMELFAVICIQTSHYVSFVKCGLGKDAPWVFFDSMADRMGEQGGYNIPEVVHVPEVSDWLSESNFPRLLQCGDDKDLPEHLRRLLCDGYMCLYQSPSVMMFQ